MTGVFSIKCSANGVVCCVGCPLCGGTLVYRNSKKRRVKNFLGIVTFFLLRRFLCQLCGKLHTELPDIIQPYKHYDSETIQSVIDGTKNAALCEADEATIRRWKKTFANEEPDIEQRLSSVYALETDSQTPITTPARIINGIKSKNDRWLAFVIALLINNGHIIRTQFAFCPTSLYCKIAPEAQRKAEGGKEVDKTIADTG